MPKFVRAKDPISGAEVTVTEQRAKALKLETVNKPATSRNFGHPLPGKPAAFKPKAAAASDKKEH